MSILFAILVLLGQILVSVGVSMRSIPLMLAGRTIFGLGADSLSITPNALMTTWLEDGELAFALAVSLSVGRLGSVINDVLSPAIASAVSVAGAFWFGALLCMISLVSAIAITKIDAAFDPGRLGAGKNDELTGRGLRRFASYGSIDITETDEDEGMGSGAARQSTKVLNRKTISPMEVCSFSFRFWLLCASCVVVYGTVLTFNNTASGFLQTR
jgi:MFS family permease